MDTLPNEVWRNDEVSARIRALTQFVTPDHIASRSHAFKASATLCVNETNVVDCFVGTIVVRGASQAWAQRVVSALLIDNWLFCLEYNRGARLFTYTALYGCTHHTFHILPDELVPPGDAIDLHRRWLCRQILPLTHPLLVDEVTRCETRVLASPALYILE